MDASGLADEEGRGIARRCFVLLIVESTTDILLVLGKRNELHWQLKVGDQFQRNKIDSTTTIQDASVETATQFVR